MPILECPTCRWLLVLPERKVGVAFCCLNCEHNFDTSTAPVVHVGPGRGNPPAPAAPGARESPIEAERAARTVLSRSHLCSHPGCERELTAIGKRNATRECPHCHQPTSIYAILHRCSECDVLLETPRRCMGSMIRCPVCMEQITVPAEALFNDERKLPDHTWLGFRCHGCGAPLQCPSSEARKEAVCPQCQRVLTIPVAGERVAASPAGLAIDGHHGLHTQLTRTCPGCNRPSPRQSVACRHCGGRLA